MNQLEFSPISERDQQSIDTFSFIHNTLHIQKNKNLQNVLHGSKKIFEKLCRISHNRQSYSFQLLKQFILFSSDEQTIQIHYKYTQYELDKGTEYLQNTYGMQVKLTLGKAFQDIRNFSRKKSVYKNPVYLQKLISVYDKLMNLNRQESYRCVIKILAKFIEKEVIIKKNNSIQQQTTNQLIRCLQKQIQTEQVQQQKLQQITDFQKQLLTQCRNNEEQKRIGKVKRSVQLIQSKQKRLKKQDLIKTAKFSVMSNQKPSFVQHSKWKQQVEDVDSYQEQPSQNYPRMIIKSLSNQLGTNACTNSQMMDSTKQRNKKKGLKENKCLSTRMASARCPQQYDVFRTKKKYQEPSIYRNSAYQNQNQRQENAIQNIVIIRSSRQHRRSPDRYIRVPIVSEQIKIIQLIPDQEKKKKLRQRQMKYNQELKLNTISSKNNSFSNKKSYQSSKKSSSRKGTQNFQDIEKQQKNYGSNRKRSMVQAKQKKVQQFNSHDCQGCKYCVFIKQMETYRKQRTNTKPLSFV